MDGLAGALAARGWLILSGILDGEWPSVRAAAEARGLRLVEVDADGEWRSARFERDT
jgi:ribosomal protein L11 methylase PrmA